MGQAFDRDGHVLGEAYGETKREVFEKLNREFPDAHEIRIRSLAPDLEPWSASEVLYAFVGWLTTRDKPVTLSSHHRAAVAAELVVEFCRRYEFDPPRPGWERRLRSVS